MDQTLIIWCFLESRFLCVCTTCMQGLSRASMAYQQFLDCLESILLLLYEIVTKVCTQSIHNITSSTTLRQFPLRHLLFHLKFCMYMYVFCLHAFDALLWPAVWKLQRQSELRAGRWTVDGGLWTTDSLQWRLVQSSSTTIAQQQRRRRRRWPSSSVNDGQSVYLNRQSVTEASWQGGKGEQLLSSNFSQFEKKSFCRKYKNLPLKISILGNIAAKWNFWTLIIFCYRKFAGLCRTISTTFTTPPTFLSHDAADQW